MRIKRDHLTALLNSFYDRGNATFSVEHPSEEIGELVRISLKGHDSSEVEFTKSIQEYAEARDEVRRLYPETVANDLPEPGDYLRTVLSSGLLDIANLDEVTQLLDRYGNPDLMAGHPPVFAGFDTNLLSWRIDRVLGLNDPVEGIGYVNGFVLTTGVRDELDWDYKCHNTDPFEAAFGTEFDEYWNQPLGAARFGRLGQMTYRRIRDIEQALELDSETGDAAIIDAYDEYNRDNRGDILLFSNDRNFIEAAQGHRIPGQVIKFPDELPDETVASWNDVELLLYMLSIAFGVIHFPNTTMYGVWKGKDNLDWQHERVKIDARSPVLETMVERDLSIVESYEELEDS